MQHARLISRLTLAFSLLLAGAAQAHTVYARVLSATPEYQEIRVPEQVCRGSDEHRRHYRERCYTVDRIERKLTGYHVTYEYRGRVSTTHTRRHPGYTIAIEINHRDREFRDDRGYRDSRW